MLPLMKGDEDDDDDDWCKGLLVFKAARTDVYIVPWIYFYPALNKNIPFGRVKNVVWSIPVHVR